MHEAVCGVACGGSPAPRGADSRQQTAGNTTTRRCCGETRDGGQPVKRAVRSAIPCGDATDLASGLGQQLEIPLQERAEAMLGLGTREAVGYFS